MSDNAAYLSSRPQGGVNTSAAIRVAANISRNNVSERLDARVAYASIAPDFNSTQRHSGAIAHHSTYRQEGRTPKAGFPKENY
jgi:hypothetical protein